MRKQIYRNTPRCRRCRHYPVSCFKGGSWRRGGLCLFCVFATTPPLGQLWPAQCGEVCR